MKEIRVLLRTLTPIWTGDARGECKELKLTGLLGSLRWWFEALVRGMGYKACDPTSDNKCKLELRNPEEFSKIYERICPVCYLFGTTGWKARFSVEVGESNLKKLYCSNLKIKLSDTQREWYYKSGLMGKAILKFRYNDMVIGEIKNDKSKFITMENTFPSILKILLYLISEYGMLGAKTAFGYGVVNFKINENDIQIKNDWEIFEDYLKLFDKKFKEEIKNFPNLRDMFFVKFDVDVNKSMGNIIQKIKKDVNKSMDNLFQKIKKFYFYQDGIIEGNIDKWKDNNWCITSPLVRKVIRKEIKTNFLENKDLRHFLMGKVAGKNTKFSAIQVSHVYKNNEKFQFRIFGWLPDKELKSKREEVLKVLTQLFSNVPWAEFIPCQIIENWGTWESGNLSIIETKDKLKKLIISKNER